jgi:DNA repair exonuclease SbcCD ATPase subunit
MQINHIRISSILGIDQLELSPKGFTTISGPNGTGKTSVLESIKGALAAGHDATLLRNGAEKGEIVLVLDDGLEITKTVKSAGSTTTVRRDGEKISRPAETIKALTDALSVNPVDFLLAKPKDRTRVLLEAMPLEADTVHLTSIAGVPVSAQPGVHALHVIDQVHKQVYDARTGTNRAVKEKQATINQLEAAVPPAPEGVSGDEGELEQGIRAASDERENMLGRITAQLTKLRTQAQADIDAVRAEVQRKIDEAKADGQAKVDAINAELSTKEGKAAAARENANTKCTDIIQPLNTQLQIIRNDRESAGRRKQTLDTIATMQTEHEQLKAEAEQQTGALEAIEQYKSDLLASLPIPGLEVRDGEIYRNGVVFDRLNTAQQVEVAVEVAKLRAADLGVVCVDGLELLDSTTLEAFKESALESGLQLFITRVTDEPMSIETTD